MVRLFILQVIAHDHYQQIAAKEHYGFSELPAHRGEIFIKDYASGEQVRVATNSTLDMLFADPTLIKDKKLVADRIAPIIYNLEEAQKADQERVEIAKSRALSAEEYEKIKPYTDQELYQNFYNEFLEKINSDIRPMIILSTKVVDETAAAIRAANLPGVEVTENNAVRVYPPKIVDLRSTTTKLGEILDTPPLQLESLLQSRNRYVVLKRKLPAEISDQIKEIISKDEGGSFKGLGLREEYFRYYPENTLAANLIGFINNENEGIYGIESRFNTELRGVKGLFQTQKDSVGRLITVGDSVLQPAQDGENITLTIDRSIQMAVENKLARTVENTRADSGQVIIMNPKTGAIIAMANYPSFDPNNFTAVGAKENIVLTEQEIKDLVPIEDKENTFWFYRNAITQDRFMVFKKNLANGNVIYEKYKNVIGGEAYQNKTVTSPYEPGSVFKPITMAIALDDQAVTPQTSFNDPGVLKVDEFEIKNVSAKCTGRVDMTKILAQSCNTGIGRVVQKIGRNLFYSYLKKFNFGERTEIELDNELGGKLEHFTQWAESELVTHSFGQGFTTNMVQIVGAYAALANKGILMQPYIVDTVEKNGVIIKTEPKILTQVVRPETAETIKGMLVAVIEEGVENQARLAHHYVAGKTGTSQTYRFGKPLTGAGTTIATLAGFGPVKDPKFVILVKLDRPRSSEWSGQTAAPYSKI